MKKFCEKLIRIVTLSIALIALPALSRAQTRELTHDFTEFDSIEAYGDFDITLVKSEMYSIKLTVDSQLSSYIDTYVKGKVLYLNMNSKLIPKEVKKMYKGRNAPQPVLRAVLYTPWVENVTLHENVTLASADFFEVKRLELNLLDNSLVKSFNAYASSIAVKLEKKAGAVMNLEAEKDIDISERGNANLKLTQVCDDLSVATSGSSTALITGDTKTVKVNTSGSSTANITSRTEVVELECSNSSRVTLSGQSYDMIIRASNSSYIEAVNMPVEAIEAVMANSATANTTVSEVLSVDLVGGSSLYYGGNPEIRIIRVIKSTLSPSSASR